LDCSDSVDDEWRRLVALVEREKIESILAADAFHGRRRTARENRLISEMTAVAAAR
jgi:hypothetical protein